MSFVTGMMLAIVAAPFGMIGLSLLLTWIQEGEEMAKHEQPHS
jgi:hypothetical protein